MPTFHLCSKYYILFHFSSHTFYREVIGLSYLSCVSHSLLAAHNMKHPSHLIYDTNLFDNNFNLFNLFLTNFNSSVEFAICSGIPSSEGLYHMGSSPLICNVNLFPQFYMVGVLSGDYSQADHKFNFNANVNVTVDSYMNRSVNFSFSQFPLIAVLVFLKVKIRKALCCSIVSSEDLLKFAISEMILVKMLNHISLKT